MGRHKTDPSTPRRGAQLIVSEEVHHFLRVRAADQNVTLNRVLEDLVRAEKDRGPLIRGPQPEN